MTHDSGRTLTGNFIRAGVQFPHMLVNTNSSAAKWHCSRLMQFGICGCGEADLHQRVLALYSLCEKVILVHPDWKGRQSFHWTKASLPQFATSTVVWSAAGFSRCEDWGPLAVHHCTTATAMHCSDSAQTAWDCRAENLENTLALFFSYCILFFKVLSKLIFFDRNHCLKIEVLFSFFKAFFLL